MKKLQLLLSTILVSIGVALVYYYFEAAVRHSTNYVWVTLINTNTRRILVVPVCLVISLIFFGVQHYLDPRSEDHPSEGLGEAPTPTVVNLAKVLLIGFLSLLAGASLGPEAILVPACLVVGGYAGVKLYKGDSTMVKLLSMVGFVALFAAFFDSFVAGMLGLILITKQLKIKLDTEMLIIAAIASWATVLALNVLESNPYAKLPPTTWKFSFTGLLAIILLAAGGYGYTYLIGAASKAFNTPHAAVANKSWWLRGLGAAIGLSILYLLGGHLVEFTGNESIQPMLQQAASLGFIGLAWLFIIKILAISWSKTLGYRGGLVFPSIFAASVLVAIVQLLIKDVGFTLGLVATMVGIIAADTKVKVLF